jgi:AraC-like DNA-binding protein
MARLDKRNVTRYWWDQHVPGLSLLHADFTSHDYPAHAHDAFVIAVTELGGARIRSRRIEEAVCPATLFVSNPAEPQSASMGDSPRWRYRSIYLARPAIEAIARDLGIALLPHFTRNMLGDPDLIDGFSRLHRALAAGQHSLLEHELLVGVFAELFRRHGSGGRRAEAPPRDRTLAGTVIEMMQARYSENLRLDELAAAVGLTSFQLLGLFKRTTGLTPHAYLIQVRLHVACRHLWRGYPLAESALAAGFCDQSALTKHFKRWYGITPLQFAQAARTGKQRQDAEPREA